MTADGVGLVTALRVLCHISCPPPTMPGTSTNTFTRLDQFYHAELFFRHADKPLNTSTSISKY